MKIHVVRDPSGEQYISFAASLAAGVVAGISIHLGVPVWFAFFEGLLLYYLWRRWRYRLFFQANAAYKARQFEESLALSMKAIQKYPLIVNSYLSAALASIALEKPERALELLNKAREIAPHHRAVFGISSNAYLSMYDGENALADANKYISLRPSDSFGYSLRAAAHNLMHHYEKSISDCNKVIELKKGVNWARMRRAVANLGMNRLDLAREDCETVISELALKPSADQLAHVLPIKATILARNLHFEEAIVDVTQALELSPNLIRALLIRAHSHCSSGYFDEAMADLNKLEENNCTASVRSYVYANRARVYLRKGELELALQNAEESVNFAPKIPSVVSSYGLVLMRAGQLEKARAALDTAISLDPYLAEAYWFRRELNEKLGQLEQAVVDRQVAESYGYKPYI